MDISFERGDPGRPKGHALVYFRTRMEPDKVYATYIIVLPISVNFSKYVPPFLTAHLGNMAVGDLSAFSLPPVPDEASSYLELQHLAELRDDDLLFAGTMHSFDLPEMMQAVGDVVNQYSQMWSDYAKPAVASSAERELDSAGVNEVLYGLMSRGDRLGELSKFVGKLRFAVEGNDGQTSTEMQEEMEILSRHLPEDYYIPRLIEAVMDPSARGSQLAKLYLDRCYKLSNGDDAGACDLEEEINVLQTSG